MKVEKFINGPFMVNSYLVINKSNNEAVIIDPGSDVMALLLYISKNNIIPKAIVATHGHIDHVAGVNQIKMKYDIPFYLNKKDQELIEMIPSQARMFGISNPGIPAVDKELPLSGSVELAGMKFELFYTPGHSKGSVSLYINDSLFSGDVLFNMSIGRTDLPGGDYNELIKSIKKNIFTLPNKTKVYSGHGGDTTVEIEKTHNPFLN